MKTNTKPVFSLPHPTLLTLGVVSLLLGLVSLFNPTLTFASFSDELVGPLQTIEKHFPFPATSCEKNWFKHIGEDADLNFSFCGCHSELQKISGEIINPISVQYLYPRNEPVLGKAFVEALYLNPQHGHFGLSLELSSYTQKTEQPISCEFSEMTARLHEIWKAATDGQFELKIYGFRSPTSTTRDLTTTAPISTSTLPGFVYYLTTNPSLMMRPEYRDAIQLGPLAYIPIKRTKRSDDRSIVDVYKRSVSVSINQCLSTMTSSGCRLSSFSIKSDRETVIGIITDYISDLDVSLPHRRPAYLRASVDSLGATVRLYDKESDQQLALSSPNEAKTLIQENWESLFPNHAAVVEVLKPRGESK